MTAKKAKARIEELQQKEKQLFDSYRKHHRDSDKVRHLRLMADTIEEKDKLKKKYRI
jgi:hypothetical protein